MRNKYKKIIAVAFTFVVVVVLVFVVAHIEKENKIVRYEVTQYPGITGNQGSFYTITGSDGTLVVIDGGWAEDADYVRQVLAEYGNHVNAWFVTHPHRDHAGAFNVIFANPKEITIDAVYDNGFDYAFIEKVGEPYDDITVMETYEAITKDDARVQHLARGQELVIGELSFQSLNAFDEVLLENVGEEKDYQNNGAMILYVQDKNLAPEDGSMLLCSDVKWNMEESLSDTISKLRCHAIQVGHHGNWGFSKELYEQTGAKVYFFDAPEWITDSEQYPAHELKETLRAEHAEVYEFSTAPNRMAL